MKKVFVFIIWALTVLPVFAAQTHWEGAPACRFAANEAFETIVIPESELVINEFMYNNPGTDDYEFLEIFNAGDVPIQMEGYRLTTGVTFTFPNFTLPAGGYVIVAVDSAKFRMAFNVTAFQWNSSQALNNTGELITLVNPADAIMDTVRYSSTAMPWPASANGGGPSVQLCDPASDNSNGTNWAASAAATGFFVNGIEVLATPGAANNCEPPAPVNYPPYEIGVVTTTNADGVPDSLNVRCQLQGTVYGINLRTTGLQFTIIDDQNDGIAVFSAASDFGYSVEESNEIIIRGRVTQFNGLTQILPDTVILVAQSNPLIPATTVTQLNETTESQLVRIENLTLVDPAQWTNAGAAFNVDATNGTNTFQIRIVSTSNIFGTTAPTGTFHLTGIGGQFDATAPYSEGYQIFPRYLTDIDVINSVSDPVKVNQDIRISPNPALDLILIRAESAFDAVRVTDAAGRTVYFHWFAPVTELNLDTTTWKRGTYQVAVMSGKTTRLVQVVKAR